MIHWIVSIITAIILLIISIIYYILNGSYGGGSEETDARTIIETTQMWMGKPPINEKEYKKMMNEIQFMDELMATIKNKSLYNEAYNALAELRQKIPEIDVALARADKIRSYQNTLDEIIRRVDPADTSNYEEIYTEIQKILRDMPRDKEFSDLRKQFLDLYIKIGNALEQLKEQHTIAASRTPKKMGAIDCDQLKRDLTLQISSHTSPIEYANTIQSLDKAWEELQQIIISSQEKAHKIPDCNILDVLDTTKRIYNIYMDKRQKISHAILDLKSIIDSGVDKMVGAAILAG